MKRIISLLLALVMVIGNVPPVIASANETLQMSDELWIDEVSVEEETVPETTAPVQEETVPETTAPVQEETVPETMAPVQEETVPETMAPEQEETVTETEETEPEKEPVSSGFEVDENWTQEEYDQAKREFVMSLIGDTTRHQANVYENRLSNEYIEFAINSNSGRFTVGTTGGNPEIASDDYKILLYGHSNPSTSYTTVQVNGYSYKYGDYGFTVRPYFDGNSNISEAVFGDIRVRQVITLVENASTMRRDVVEIKYIVTNEGGSNASLGMRIMLDTMLGHNDAAPFRIPGIGDATTEMEFVGADIPQYWQAFDSLTNPTVVSYGSFLTGEILPDKVQFTNWSNVYNQSWGYTPWVGSPNGDSAVSIIWERNLAAGARETYVTRYGLSELLQDLQPPLGLTLASGAKIQVDRATNTYPPYTITAYIQNLGNGAAENAVCRIDLPPYLDFIDPSDTGIFPLGEVAPNQLITLEKDVYVKNPPDYEVSTSYTVSVSADNAETKTLNKAVRIGPKDPIEYHDTLSELTDLDYLAFAQVAYQDFEVGQTIRDCLVGKPGNMWDDVWGIDNIKYSELCEHVANWTACYEAWNYGTGFYAVAFRNDSGEAVLAYRGSIPPGQWGDDGADAYYDWAVNDLPMILTNSEWERNQFSDALTAYEEVADLRNISRIHVTGHSLGGLWGNVISAYSGVKGVTFNAISALDVIHYNHPDLMGEKFQGVDSWNFVDNANMYDIAAGMTEVYASIAGGTKLKPFIMRASNFGPLAFGKSHSMNSMVKRTDSGELRMNPGLASWEGSTGISNYMTFTLKSIDMGHSGNNLFDKGLSVAVSRTSYGGNGFDQIFSSINGDTLVGGNGTDYIDGGWGDDTYIYYKGNGLDQIHDTGGDDSLYLYGFSGSDSITVQHGGNTGYITILCNNQPIVRIYNEGRAYSLWTVDSFKVYVDRPGQSPRVHDITDAFERSVYTQRVVIQCPVNVEVLDADGNVVYIMEDGVVGNVYTEYGNFYVFQEEDGGYGKVAELVEGYTLRIVGVDDGNMEIDYRNVADGQLEEPRNFTQVPVTDDFVATFEQTDGGELLLAADTDGDGLVDAKIGYDGQPVPVEQIKLSQEYLLMEPETSVQLTAEVTPEKLDGFLRWSVEEGGEAILSVDEQGNVTALSEGTAYVLATVDSGINTMTARCRVDVSENAEQSALDGIQLNTANTTVELYSTDYARFDILLMLPQNYSAAAGYAEHRTQNTGVAVERAWFADPALDALFELQVLDDRSVQIVPRDTAVENPAAVKNKYTGAVTALVQGEEYTAEAPLTLTVKKSTPKLKATVASFNSFYSGQFQEIVITGGTPVEIIPNDAKNTAKTSAIPGWLRLRGRTLHLTEDAPLKNVSGSAYILVQTEEWRIPAALTVSVKNAYKVPGLKLSATNVTVTGNAEESSGVAMQLQCKNKKDTLSDLMVSGITAPAGYQIVDFNPEDGSFVLKTDENFVPGKIVLNVAFSNTDVVLPLNLTVKTAAVTLKLSANTVTLNAAVGDQAAVGVTAAPADFVVRQPQIRLTNAAGEDKLESGELEIDYEDGKLLVGTTDDTPEGASYKLYVSAGGSKEAALTIKTTSAAPSVTLKTKGNMDISFPERSAQIIPTFKNYSNVAANYKYTIAQMRGKEVVNENVTEAFVLEENGDGSLSLRCVDEDIDVACTYAMKMRFTLPDGTVCENTLNLKVKRTAVTLKLSASGLSLNKQVGDVASVGVTCNTKGYAFEAPVWQLMDKTGKADAAGMLDISFDSGRLYVAVNENTVYGETYKILLKANAHAPAAALTVTIPAANKSQVTSSLKATGKLDVIRSSSAVTIVPAYKNCAAETEKTEALFIYCSADNYTEHVNHLFSIEPNGNGGYVVSRAEDAKLDHTLKYQAKLTTLINGFRIESKPIAVSVAMGNAKLTLETQDAELFAKDKNDRIAFRFTAADGAQNQVARVEIKDAKYQDVFEIISYGNGEFAVAFKDSEVSASLIGKKTSLTVNLNLNVYLEGNQTAKANTTGKLKITVVK